MSEERELKDAIDALNKAMELNKQVAESNQQTLEMVGKLVASFSEAAASMKETASKLEALSQAPEEPAPQARQTKFSPTHEVSNDGDDLIKVSPDDDESGDSYIAYDFGATGMNRSRYEYDRLYEACLASQKEAEYHAMILQLAQNMAALKSYEYSDEVFSAEQDILDSLYDEDRAEEAMDEGEDYRGGLRADWDSLLANLQKALGLVSEDEGFEDNDV